MQKDQALPVVRRKEGRTDPRSKQLWLHCGKPRLFPPEGFCTLPSVSMSSTPPTSIIKDDPINRWHCFTLRIPIFIIFVD